MYLDDIKVFAKKRKKELNTLTQAIRIESQDIEMEFGIEKYAILTVEKKKRKQRK